jgi:Spy/CpxP family protein refolding chaperone
MHPHVIGWWRARHERGHGHCHASAECGPGAGGGRGHGGPWAFAGGHDGPGFGVRRPLRFLAHKLDLNEKQAAQLAKIVDELKTERAQAAVDDRRSVAQLADAVSGESFDAEAAKQAGKRRVESTERVEAAVAKALGELHALLDAEQRETLSYLLRSGLLGI